MRRCPECHDDVQIGEFCTYHECPMNLAGPPRYRPSPVLIALVVLAAALVAAIYLS